MCYVEWEVQTISCTINNKSSKRTLCGSPKLVLFQTMIGQCSENWRDSLRIWRSYSWITVICTECIYKFKTPDSLFIARWLCARHCSRHWRYEDEQDKIIVPQKPSVWWVKEVSKLSEIRWCMQPERMTSLERIRYCLQKLGETFFTMKVKSELKLEEWVVNRETWLRLEFVGRHVDVKQHIMFL